MTSTPHLRAHSGTAPVHISDRPWGATTVRFVRYTPDLAPVRRLYVDALGMQVHWEAAPRPADHPQGPEHGMLMAGFPGAGWHIEWVEEPAWAQPAHTRQHLDDLIFYLGQEPSAQLLTQLTQAGATLIAGNPYWDACGVTLLDPDGHRFVLTTRTWAYGAAPTR